MCCASIFYQCVWQGRRTLPLPLTLFLTSAHCLFTLSASFNIGTGWYYWYTVSSHWHCLLASDQTCCKIREILWRHEEPYVMWRPYETGNICKPHIPQFGVLATYTDALTTNIRVLFGNTLNRNAVQQIHRDACVTFFLFFCRAESAGSRNTKELNCTIAEAIKKKSK